MRRVTLILLLVVLGIPGLTKYTTNTKKSLTAMQALDLVKEAYATNFTKNSLKGNPEDYFYKLDIADYYLVYEDTEDSSGYYLFHLYEFVLDDIDTGIGHTVTYGWYWVNPSTGEIWVY